MSDLKQTPKGRGTDKSVRDHTQKATFDGETITVQSHVGRRRSGEPIRLTLEQWRSARDLYLQPSLYLQRELVRSATPTMDDEPGGPDQADRIRDSMIAAIEKALDAASII